ncbi:MAG: heavy metal translocating P-type ATPase [Eubacterium sp.]|jgi:Cu2+-exporting ATPase|nr:heavy metal translocating P-type ATPase [Eubacterium sp.]
MEQYHVTGMSCAACSSRVEKAVCKVSGVSSVSVNLLTNSMGVEGTAPADLIVKAVEDAGYHAEPKNSKNKNAAGADTTRSNIIGVNTTGGNTLSADPASALEDHDTPKLRARLLVSVSILVVLMYISMGNMMWGWYLPEALEQNQMALALIQLLLTTAIMVINQRFFISGFRGLWHRAPNMDTLVALGAGAAYGYSLYALFAMSYALTDGDLAHMHHYVHELYFESAATILTLITVGKTLEARSKGRTTDALKSLMRLAPQRAVLLVNGTEQEVPIGRVKKGDLFVVRPGESIPVDGIVVKGNGSVNEAALTGESIPVDKAEGDTVSAATINQDGFLTCQADRVGEDTTLSQIIQMVSDAAATKAPIAKVADRVSGVFVPIVIAIAALTIIVWMMTGQSFGYALARGISVLVISCPCALGLATPVAIMVGNGMGAKNGILFKTAVSLEETGKAQIVVLDKTGTITFGEPKVTDVIAASDGLQDELIRTAYALECMSEHPLAKAVVEYGSSRGIQKEMVSSFKAVSGNGLQGMMGNDQITGGKQEYIETVAEIPEKILETSDRLAGEGKTPLYFAKNNTLLGCIAVADVMKEDSPKAIRDMQRMGMKVVMLTGDNERTAKAIGTEAGVDEIIAGVLPDGKEEQVRKFASQGKVIMVGDGINDAPALTRADIGIAIGAGTDVAVDAADVVLMKSRLSDVPAAIRLSRGVLKNIHENLFWAFVYNVIGIPLAAGVWIPLFGWQLNPMFGAAAMGLSSFCVVSNALRLNWLDVHGGKRSGSRREESRTDGAGTMETYADANKETAREISKCYEEKEKKIMKKTMKIEGMMCGHCEARVQKCLEKLDGVESAAVSHESGTAEVTLTADVSDDILRKAVEEQDYQVIGIE